MPDEPSAALRVALAYHQAWTAKDLTLALKYVADDIVCDAPAGRIEGREAFRAFLEPFAQTLISASLIAAYGDERRALMMYDTSSPLVASGPGAECLTVELGKITHNRFIFDRLPFAMARQAMP